MEVFKRDTGVCKGMPYIDLRDHREGQVMVVMFLYARGGFIVRHALMDMEFEKIKDLLPLVEVNTTAAREHVGLIERKIRHIKEKVRATTCEFLFFWIPILILIQTVYGATFWINAFPVRSENFGFSPREIVTGC